MGLFDKIFGQRQHLPPTVYPKPDSPGRVVEIFALVESNTDASWLEASHWHGWEAPCNLIAGESFRQKEIKKLAGVRQLRENGVLRPVCVTFTREPENAYDTNAIAAHVDGVHVGYLRREPAAQVAPAMDRLCRSFKICGVIRGGSPDAEHVGIHIWPGRRLGPGLDLPSLGFEVGWPPYDGEGT